MWNQSVLGEQNSNHPPPSGFCDSEEDVTGHFADMNFSPDDNVSTASGMDNSTSSQVNSSRRISRTGQGYVFPFAQYQGSMPSGMVPPGTAFSPAINSEGRATSILSSGRSQMPPGLISSATSDLTDNTFNTSEYANFTTGQEFVSMTQGEPFQSLNPQFSPVGIVQGSVTSNYQGYGKQFGGGTVNTAAFPSNMTSQHNQARSGSAASFLGSDVTSGMTGHSFSRPPLVRQGSSQTFSTRSASLIEGANNYDFQVDSSQPAQYVEKPSDVEIHSSIHRSSQLSQNEIYDAELEARHGYLRYSMYVISLLHFTLGAYKEARPESNLPLDHVDEDSFPPSNEISVRQNSEERGEAEARQARSHPWYGAGPQSDDLYHCPWVAKEHCPHKPTKLKCVYEYEHSL